MGHGESQMGYLANDINCNREYARSRADTTIGELWFVTPVLYAWLKLIVAKTRYHKTSCHIFPRLNSVLNEGLIVSKYDNNSCCCCHTPIRHDARRMDAGSQDPGDHLHDSGEARV